ncbi:hypothetical protein [Pseudomonas phage LKA1]|uniref:Uncharacterized protein n=1 Tax=Pseudomonas phage LKA1 TaxID=386793 RepID=Q0E600_9CAUD|nr:hypothetical protein AV952_gp14 [Pseudomonas phage LKA1]CAK24982.1 hypothetical protein [Pseudomonas phage LKA1]
MIASAKHTEVIVTDDAPGCPIPGRTRSITAACGLRDHSNTVSISVDKVDGDVSIAIYEDDDMYDGPCLTKETALALCAALKSELEKL